VRRGPDRPLPVVGALAADPGELVVLVPSLTVRHKVGAAWVTATVPVGQPVGELADDVRDHLLRTKQIGRRNGAPYVAGGRRTSN
jgi:hypothetical protein